MAVVNQIPLPQINIMKKIALLAFTISVLSCADTKAQFYLRAGAGYAMPMAGQTLDGGANPYSGTRSNSTYSIAYNMKNVSFSSGSGVELGFGYLFNDHVGVQLDGSLGLANKKYSFSDKNVNVGSGYQGDITITMQAKSALLVMPGLVLQTGNSSACNLYTRFGAALPLSSGIANEESIYVPSASVIEKVSSKVTSSFSLGLAAAAGIQYKIGENSTLWAEVNMLSMSLLIKEVTYTTASINGVTYPLDTLGIPHSIKYSKNAVIDSTYSNLPAYSLPFSNVGFHVGITVLLSEKRHKNESMGDKKNFKRSKF